MNDLVLLAYRKFRFTAVQAAYETPAHAPNMRREFTAVQAAYELYRGQPTI